MKSKRRSSESAPDDLVQVRFLRKDGQFEAGQQYAMSGPQAEKFVRQGAAEVVEE